MGLGTGTEGAFNFGTALNIGGGVYQALQGLAAGKAEAEAYEFQAKQYETEAKGIMDKAHADTVLFDEGGRRFTAGQRAEAAAGGMSGSQSTLELLSDTARQMELDRLAIKYNADLQAGQLKNQAYLSRVAGRNARIAGRTQAITSLLNTATQVSDTWYRWKQTSAGAGEGVTMGRPKGYKPSTSRQWGG